MHCVPRQSLGTRSITDGSGEPSYILEGTTPSVALRALLSTWIAGTSPVFDAAFVGCSSENDIKLRRQFADGRSFQRFEVGQDQFTIDQVSSVVEDSVPRVARMTSHQQLSREDFAVANL